MSVKLVEVTRGNIVESVHRGDLAVVSSKGGILYKLGDIERITFFRSASKPLQAVAALQCGIMKKFNFELREIALMISSHSGEKQHIEGVVEIMKKLGVTDEVLNCGIHEPLNKDAANSLIACGQGPTKLHCNCSGKHLGVIAAAKAKGLPTQNYEKMDHPIQKIIDEVLSDFSGVEINKIIKGLDGCGIPVYAVPLKNMAKAYANLVDFGFSGGKYSESQKSVIDAMKENPEMIAGSGRFDTELLKVFGNRIIGKIGAEGVYCAAIPEKHVGIALKIEDGNSRAIAPVILEVLLQLEIIKGNEIGKLKEYWKPVIHNHKGEVVGEIRPVFEMG